MTDITPILFCIIIAGLVLFQITLALGAPLGKYAWGGQHIILPRKLRISSLSSVVIYLFFTIIILDRAGILELINNQFFVDIATWVLVGYFWLGVLMNAVSRSKPERNLMTPVALALAILTTLIAVS
ncbi:MAG TPA: hypothetical protein VF281_02545 [Candidatus Saccharimonadales bacterium]